MRIDVVPPEEVPGDRIHRVDVADEVAEINARTGAHIAAVPRGNDDSRAHLRQRVELPSQTTAALLQRVNAAILAAHVDRAAGERRLRGHPNRALDTERPFQAQVSDVRGAQAGRASIHVARIGGIESPAGKRRRSTEIELRRRALTTGRQQFGVGRHARAGKKLHDRRFFFVVEPLSLDAHGTRSQRAVDRSRCHQLQQVGIRRAGASMLMTRRADFVEYLLPARIRSVRNDRRGAFLRRGRPRGQAHQRHQQDRDRSASEPVARSRRQHCAGARDGPGGALHRGQDRSQAIDRCFDRQHGIPRQVPDETDQGKFPLTGEVSVEQCFIALRALGLVHRTVADLRILNERRVHARPDRPAGRRFARRCKISTFSSNIRLVRPDESTRPPRPAFSCCCIGTTRAPPSIQFARRAC